MLVADVIGQLELMEVCAWNREPSIRGIRDPAFAGIRAGLTFRHPVLPGRGRVGMDVHALGHLRIRLARDHPPRVVELKSGSG